MTRTQHRRKHTMYFVFLTVLALLFTSPTYAKPVMSKPKVIIFDVNETLLDLGPLRTAVGKTIDGREDLLPLWFSTMLHYSLVDTLTDNYHDFGQIGSAALVMVAETQGIEIDIKTARAAIVGAITQLPPHEDVKSGLIELNKQGFTLVSLTNSSHAGVAAQFKFAGLTHLFSERYSVEDVGVFKPHPKPYQMVLEKMGIQPHEALMVAAHAWDLAGAKAVGLQTAFIRRPGKTLYPNTAMPDYVVDNIQELIRQLNVK